MAAPLFSARTDRIALLSGNSVAFVCIWLACMSINVAPAFINHGLTGQGLLHCIKVSKAKLLLFEPAFEDNVAAIQEDLKSTELREYVAIYDGIKLSTSEKAGAPTGAVSGAKILDLPAMAVANGRPKPIDASYRKDVTEKTTACLIYTSGTTGLPKAALCSHGRLGAGVVVFTLVNSFSKKDRIYTPMPLYHSSASFLCIAASWYSGATVIVGRRFSASRYWQEVRAYDATVVQYIGEIARYLLAVPPSDLDKQHRVRMAYGNGMRPDVWTKFRERYGVREISEFYASSEGNGALLNYNTGPFGAGAIGRFGPVARWARPSFKIARVDPITEDIYRDPKTGLCVECVPGEAGEFLMKIDTSKPEGDFQGYADNPEATQKKVAADVFAKGDRWFRSGDLLKRDADGESASAASAKSMRPPTDAHTKHTPSHCAPALPSRLLLVPGPPGRHLPLARRERLHGGGGAGPGPCHRRGQRLRRRGPRCGGARRVRCDPRGRLL